MKINPVKYTLVVTSGKFLGFIVHYRVIEVDQSKIKRIQEMPEPKNFKVAWHISEDSSQILQDAVIPSVTL